MEAQSSTSSRRRWLLVSVVGIIIILLALGIGGRIWVGNQLSPGALVERIEAELNARVHIDDTQVSLFGSPARVRLIGVKMGPRDANANAGIPLDERPEMSRVNLECEEVVLAIPLGGLLRNEIDLRRLRFGKLEVVDAVQESGKSRLNEMFEMPDIVGGRDNPKKAVAEPKEESDEVVVEPGRRLFDLGSASFFASDGVLRFEESKMALTFERQDMLLQASELNFQFTEVVYDPNEPGAGNLAQVALSGSIGISRPDKGVNHGVLHLQGAGETTLVDPESGKFSPTSQLHLEFREDSEINLLPSLEKIQSRLEQLKALGVDLSEEVGDSVAFEEGADVRISYDDGVVVFESPLRAVCGDFLLEIEPGGTIAIEEGTHEVTIHLIADAALSDKVRSELRQKAELIPSVERRDKFLAELEEEFFIDDVFRPVFLSSGSLDDPDVELANDLPDIEDFARGLLEDFGIDREQQDQLKKSLQDLLRNR